MASEGLAAVEEGAAILAQQGRRMDVAGWRWIVYTETPEIRLWWISPTWRVLSWSLQTSHWCRANVYNRIDMCKRTV